MLRALAATGKPAAACLVGGGVEPVERGPPGGDARGGGPRRRPPRRRTRPSAPGPPRGRVGAPAARCAACSRAARSAARPRRSWPSASGTWSPTRRRAGPGACDGRAARPRLPRPGRGGVHPRPAPPDDRPGRARGAPDAGGGRPRGGRSPARRRPRLREPPRSRPARWPRSIREALATRPQLAVVGYVLRHRGRSAGAQPPGGERSPRPACAWRPTNAAAARLAARSSPDEDPSGHLLHQAARRGRARAAPGRGARRPGARRGAVGAVGRRGPLLPRAAGRGAPGARGAPGGRGRRATASCATPTCSPTACGPRGRPTSTTPRTACRPGRCWPCAPRGVVPAVVRTIHHVDAFSEPGARRVPARVDRGRRPPRVRQRRTGPSACARDYGVDARRRSRTASTVSGSPRARSTGPPPGPARLGRRGPRCSRWAASSRARAAGPCSRRSRGPATRLGDGRPAGDRRAARRSSTTPTTARPGSGTPRAWACAVHRGPRSARRRGRGGARARSPTTSMPALFRAADAAGLPLRARGLRPGGAGGPGRRPAGRGERPAGAARDPRGRPRLPDGAGGRPGGRSRRPWRGDGRHARCAQRLVAGGRATAARFTWEAAAEAHERVYEEIARVACDDDHAYAVWTAEWTRRAVGRRLGARARDARGRAAGVRRPGHRADAHRARGGGARLLLLHRGGVGGRQAAHRAARPGGRRCGPAGPLGEPRHGRYDLWVRSSTPADELAPAVELAKRYCWVTNTLATPPEILYHLDEGMG